MRKEEGVDATLQSDPLRYIDLAEAAIGSVAVRGPMHLCACVREERGDGEGAKIGSNIVNLFVFSKHDDSGTHKIVSNGSYDPLEFWSGTKR